jgi:hypothetical protein
MLKFTNQGSFPSSNIANDLQPPSAIGNSSWQGPPVSFLLLNMKRRVRTWDKGWPLQQNSPGPIGAVVHHQSTIYPRSLTPNCACSSFTQDCVLIIYGRSPTKPWPFFSVLAGLYPSLDESFSLQQLSLSHQSPKSRYTFCHNPVVIKIESLVLFATVLCVSSLLISSQYSYWSAQSYFTATVPTALTL